MQAHRKDKDVGGISNLSPIVIKATKLRDRSRPVDLERGVKGRLFYPLRSIHQIWAYLVRSRRDSQTPQQLHRQVAVRVSS